MSMANNLNRNELRRLFNIIDNGNGILSLAEIQAAVRVHYPHLSKYKKAIMRAYKLADRDGSGFVEFREFETLITYLKRFDQVSKIFNDLDNNKDQRVTFDEFRKGFELLYRRKANPMQLREAFDAIDTDHSGFIVFDELCMFLTEGMTQ